jgi:asparagine synthase (glutamine-hydrolysing)
MSALAGIWWRDPRRAPADPSALVHRMLDRMSDRGGDARGVRSGPGFCLGLDARWTTPEAAHEEQPVVLSDPPFWLAVDGRLDNRDEIAARLGTRGASPDAGILARWLARPGADLAALIGDFSLAAWDPRQQRLLLVRDALGARSLYYAETPEVVWFASSLAAMLVPEWYTPKPNEGFIAEYLADARASLDETPYQGILRLPQAHVLEVSRTGVHRRRYWTLDLREERSISEAHAVEEFRSLFSDAVRARLRAPTTVAFQLSGGLDSSTVVGVAHELGVTAPATYSLVYPDVPVADESTFIDAVVARCGAASVRWPVHEFPVQGFGVFADAARTADLADFANGQFIQGPFLRRARADGHQVMLTGSGGDEWLSGSVFRVPELIRQGHLLQAWRYALEYRSIPWWDPGALSVLRTTGASLLPERAKVVLRALGASPPLPSWITPELMDRVDLKARMRASVDRVPGKRDLVVRESLVRLTSGEGAFAREAHDRLGHAAGIELRHPFSDRRVVEFLIGLPDRLRLQRGEHRYLLRRAYGHLLPDIVRTRLDKADVDHLVTHAVRAIDPPAWFDRLEVVARGWVRAGAARDLWERPDRSGHALLWNVFAVEAWVRAVFSTSDHVVDTRRAPPVSE